MCETLIVVHQGKVLYHRPMEEVRERGVLLTGLIQDVELASLGANIIGSARMGTTSKVMIDDVYSKEWMTRARHHGLSIEKQRYRIIW